MSGNDERDRLTTQIGEQEFVMERHFDASRRLVFQMWTKPEHIARWWAPTGYTIPVCTIDLRPGGIWHYCMRSPEGQEHWARSVYREIVPPERLVYTSTFADEHANPIEGVPEHLSTVTFTEHAGRTKLTTRIQFTDEASLKAAMDMGMVEGLTMAWGNLARYLQNVQE